MRKLDVSSRVSFKASPSAFKADCPSLVKTAESKSNGTRMLIDGRFAFWRSAASGSDGSTVMARVGPMPRVLTCRGWSWPMISSLLNSAPAADHAATQRHIDQTARLIGSLRDSGSLHFDLDGRAPDDFGRGRCCERRSRFDARRRWRPQQRPARLGPAGLHPDLPGLA